MQKIMVRKNNDVFQTVITERTIMTEQAKMAWERFKLDVAIELKIPYRFGYNGGLTRRDCGRLGGEITRRCVLEGKINIIKRYMEKTK